MPGPWGLPGQYEACYQETRERRKGRNARRKQRQGRLARDHQEERARPSHPGRTEELCEWLRGREDRREDLAHDAVERVGKQVIVRLAPEDGDVGAPVVNPVGVR